MKTIVMVMIIFIMSSTLVADTVLSNQLGYATSKSNIFPESLLSVQPKGYSDLELKLGISEDLQQLSSESSNQNNSLLRVLVWMNYEF